MTSPPVDVLVEVEDRLIVLTHVEGKYYAIDDVCTHDGGPLSDGVLSGHAIACPRHGAKFDIRTGKALTMPAAVFTLKPPSARPATSPSMALASPTKDATNSDAGLE